MRRVKRELATKLLYETLASELVDETLRIGKFHVGQWMETCAFQDKQAHTVHSFYNTGLPVTFEITEDFDGILTKTHERPTYLWEPGFDPFIQWMVDKDLTNDLSTVEWLDGIMFNHVAPPDFQFGIVDSWPVTLGFRCIQTTRVHFQPIDRHRMGLGLYEAPLEVEFAMLNFSKSPSIQTLAMSGLDNYYDYKGDRTTVTEKLLKFGFEHNTEWSCPENHKRMLNFDPST